MLNRDLDKQSIKIPTVGIFMDHNGFQHSTAKPRFHLFSYFVSFLKFE